MNKIESGLLEYIELRRDVLKEPLKINNKLDRSRRRGYLEGLDTMERIVKEDYKLFQRDEDGSYEQLYMIVKERELHSALENIIKEGNEESSLYHYIGLATAWVDLGREMFKIHMNLKFGEGVKDGSKRAIQEMEQEPGEDLRSEGNNQR